MKFKKIKWGVVLSGIFCFLWIYLNRNYLLELETLGIKGVIYLTSGYAGYNCIISHGSIYAMMFVFLLQDVLHKDNIQILIRMKRKTYVSLLYKDVIVTALGYSVIFLGIMVTLTMLFENKAMIYTSVFLMGAAILFLYVALYYIFVGSWFVFFKLITASNSRAIVGAIVMIVGLLCLSLFWHIWTPVSVMDVFDLLFTEQLYLEEVGTKAFAILILIIAIYFITLYLFEDRDVLNEEK